MKAKSCKHSPQANIQEEDRQLELDLANVRQACLEGRATHEFLTPPKLSFLIFRPTET